MFIEMTGKTLSEMLHEDELGSINLKDVGVNEDSVVRVNKQGDIEVRKPAGWDILGGLIGEFDFAREESDWARLGVVELQNLKTPCLR